MSGLSDRTDNTERENAFDEENAGRDTDRRKDGSFACAGGGIPVRAASAEASAVPEWRILVIIMRQNKNLPDGTRDILYDEARLYSEITEILSNEYRTRGFRQVMTPAIEYYDVFAESGRFLEPERMYKLTDNNGRLLVLRPDNTMPIARVASTKLKNERLPQKLYYHQSVYRMNGDYSGKRSEILQSGVEMIGDCGIKSDMICLTTAIHALLALKLPFQIEIGHVGYYNALIAAMDLEESTAEKVRQFVDSKNTVSLNFLSQRSDRMAKACETIQKIPLLYGGLEVFPKAEALAEGNAEALEAAAYVRRLYQTLVDAGYGKYICVDFGLVHQIDYYTGVVIRGYAAGAGEAVLSGGRYDRLLSGFDRQAAATGFAINVCMVAEALKKAGRTPQEKKPDCVVHFAPEHFREAEEYRRLQAAAGKLAELTAFETLEESLAYAAARGIPVLATVEGGDIREEAVELPQK